MDRKRGPRLEHWLSRIPNAASATSILSALIVLSGWMFRIPILRSFFPGQPPMRPNAALCFVLVGVSLWLLHEEGISDAGRLRRRLAGRLFAAAATIIGLLSLSESLLGVDLGTDRLLFHNFPVGLGGAHPLRIPPASALGFVLMGCALLLVGRRTHGGNHPSEFLAFVAILDGAFGTLDYLLNPAVLSTGMALNASLLFMVFGCGLLSGCAQDRLRALLTSQGLGTRAVRQLFPAAVILPVLIGWVAWRGEMAGLYGSDEGLALTVVVSIAVLALVVVWTAEHLRNAEEENRKLNEELEQRVADRTAQLEAANTQLRGEITDRKRTEEALRASEKRFRVLSEAMPQIVWSADASGGVDYYNQRAFVYGGVQLADIQGWNWASIIHSDDLDATLAAWRRALVTGEAYVIEHRLRRADGQFRWHLTCGVPVRDTEGQVVRWIGTATDIHEKKLAEEELERRVAERTAELAKSMTLLETVTSNAPVILFATDAQGVFTLHTGKAITATGRQAGEIIGKHYQEVLSYTPESQDNFRRVLDGEAFTAVVESSEGAAFETLHTPLRDAEGKITGMIGLSLDITERKRAEEAAQQATGEVQDLYNNAPCGYHSLDKDGVFLRINDTELQWLGHTREEVVGRLRFTDVITEKGKQAFTENLSRFLETGVVRDLEYELVRKDGSVLPVLLSATAVRDEDGNYLMSRSTVYDMTQLERVRQAVKVERQRFNDILEELPAFVVLLAPDYHVPFANRFFRERFGESHGRCCFEFLFGRTEPCEKCETYTVLKTKAPHRWEWTGPDGRDYDISDFPFTDTDGSSLILEMGIDITERKRAEQELRRLNRALRTLSECNEAVVRAREESELLQNVCRILVQEGGYRLAWVGFAEQDEAKTVRPVAYAGVEEGYLETLEISWADTERGRGPTGTAIRTGQPVVCGNMQKDPGIAPWREEAIRRGYASSISLPLALDGQSAGALIVYSQTADAFDAAETQLLTELASDLAYGIQALRAHAARVRSGEALRRANAYNRSLIESSLDPLVTISPEGKITDVNRATERITGSSREELIGTDFSDYFTDPKKAREGYEHVFREGWGQDYELEVQHRDGHVTPVVYNASVYRDEAGQVIGVFAAARDIAERKRMEEALRQLSGHLLEAQDEERRRIARDLHDSTTQNLAVVALNLGLIKEVAKTDEDRRKYLSESISLTELSLNELRNLSYLLHPPLLDDMGLSSALEYYVDGFRHRSGISVALEISPELGRLPKDAERALFRVVQESLTNILRHAGSPTARITIVRNPEGIVLEVVDRGHGMRTSSNEKPGGTTAKPGVGIPGMRERVRLLGGRLEINSGAQGTTVRVTLPLSQGGL